VNPLLELALTSEDWENGRTWYTYAGDRIDSVCKRYGVDGTVGRGVFAALSPGMRVEPNLDWTSLILGGWNMGDDKPADYPVPYGWKPFTLACDIRDTGDVTLLTGIKRTAFLANLLGDFSRVTVDTWALKPFGRKTVSSPTMHRGISDAYTELGEATGHAPAHAQAAVWCHLRREIW